MLEPAVQSPAETMEAAYGNAATTRNSRRRGDHVNSGRRYTAEDFRLLLARLANGAAVGPRRRRVSALSIVLPPFVAWRLFCGPLTPTVPPAEPAPEATSHAPAAHDAEQNLGPATGDMGEAQPTEAGSTATLFANQLFDSAAPESAEPETAEQPESAEPETAEQPETVEPQTVEPQAVEPQTVEPQTVEPETAEPQTVEPETAEPPETVGPQAVEPEMAEPPETVGPQAV
jgi:hypothetical protein